MLGRNRLMIEMTATLLRSNVAVERIICDG